MPQQWIWGAAGGGVSDHGALTGLADDDHSQYHNNARGDLRYSQLGHNHDLTYAPLSHAHTESDITDLGSYLTEAAADLLYADIAHTHGAADHGALSGLADDDHTQYHTDARGDARYSLLAHNHDASYYTETEVNSLLTGYSPTSHNHDASYSALGHNHDASYSATGHTHTLDGLSDVNTTGAADGKVLTYDTGVWVASTPASGVTDHGLLSGLTDDDHSQYALVDGTRPFTGTVGGVYPVADTDLATKLYVDTAVTEVIYEATSSTDTVGTIASGTYASTHGHDGTAWRITEVAANPGLDVRLNFTGVDNFNRVYAMLWYDGGAASILVQVYNYVTAGWETYATIAATTGYNGVNVVISDPLEHVDGSGNAVVRFLRNSLGKPSRNLYVDYCVIAKAGFGAAQDHGLLTGLSDDDHLQYHNDTRGDLRYSQLGHQHVEADITDLGAYLTQTDTDMLYSALGHTHTESDITDLGSYAVTGHTHVESDITDLGTYLTEAAADLLYSDISHTHSAPDHGALTGLTDDDHTQYVLLAGRAGGQTLYGGTASGDDLYLYSTSNATKGDIVLANGGSRVGIGQLPDAGVLQVYAGNSGGTPTDADYIPVSIENDTSIYVQMLTPNTAVSGLLFSDPEDFDNGYISYNHSTQTMTFAADAVDTMYMTDGRVGIGTASPQTTLHVHAAAYTSSIWLTGAIGGGGEHEPSLYMSDNRSTSHRGIRIRGSRDTAYGGHSIAFSTTADNAAELSGTLTDRMWIDRGGNVGIGTTSPSAGLHVKHTTNWLRLENPNASGRTYEINPQISGVSNAGWQLYDVTGSASVIAVDVNRYVGIGTSSPQKRLHVAGTLLVDGDEGGYANTIGFTDQNSTTVTNTYLVKGGQAANTVNTGWIKIYIGTTAAWIPYWQNATP